MTAPPFFDVAQARDGLRLELAMLDAVVASGHQTAMLWQAKEPALVLPERFSRAEPFERAARKSRTRGWPVCTRKTGGGITPQGPGVLNLALCFGVPSGQSRTILASYAKIVDPMTMALAALGIKAKATPVEGSFCDGDYNLAIARRKIVGTAQRWRGTTCLIHALLLTDIELAPAVDAVAAFSHDLQHDTQFDLGVHCRLADLLGPGQDATHAATEALWRAVSEAGYAPFAP